MKNYELLLSAEFKYLTYIILRLDEDRKLFINLYSDRDDKLELILNDNICDVYNSAITFTDEITETINSLDINNLVVKDLEDIADSINKLHSYYEYFIIAKNNRSEDSPLETEEAQDYKT